MTKKRKVICFIFVVIAYIVGCVLTDVQVAGGIFVSLSLIFTGGNAVEHLGGKIEIKASG